MASFRRKMAAIGFGGLLLLGLAAQPVAAIHSGATLDCGSAGTYTIKTATTGAGLYPPGPGDAYLLYQEGTKVATLVPFELWINGSLRFSFAAVGLASNSVDEVTCSFTASNGDYFEVLGILNVP